MKLVILSVSFLSYISLSTPTCSFQDQQGEKQGVKGMFVFGSSLVDNGNNNFFETEAKADYMPYGIDFPEGPTGRFTNGKNLVDFLGQRLDLPNFTIPSFRDPSTKGSRIVNGVNHASGSSGILDDTGFFAGNVTSLRQQIRDFEGVTLPALEAQLGCDRAEALPNYLFVVGIGGNDVVFKYFLGGAFLRIDLQAFTANLVTVLSEHLQRLYGMGARKFVVTEIYPLGSCPMVELNMPGCGGMCRFALNRAAELYNDRLNLLLRTMEQRLPGFRFMIIQTYNIVSDILSDPASKGGNGIMCERGGATCRERSEYIYYDALHPTEALNLQIAQQAFDSHNPKYAYPINVQQLSLL